MRTGATFCARRAVKTAIGLATGVFLLGALAASAAAHAGGEAASMAPTAGTEARRAPNWQSIANDMVGSGTFTRSGIVTRNGAQTLATAGGMTIRDVERQALASGFDRPESITATGLILGGRKYFVLKADATIIIGKLDAETVFAKPTAQSIVIGLHGAGTRPATAQAAIEQVATSIRNQGY
ncbi:profilin [Spirillospora sp. NPDC050679]